MRSSMQDKLIIFFPIIAFPVVVIALIVAANATRPKYDELSNPKKEIKNVCWYMWSTIQGDSRWVLTKHCEDVIYREE